MGANSSKIPTYTHVDEKAAASDIYARLDQLTIQEGSSEPSSNPLSFDNIKSWEDKLLSNPKNKFAQSALTTHGITELIKDNARITSSSNHVYSDQVQAEGNPVTNQRSSGRCWIFATCNVLRVQIAKSYNLEEFQLSQSYLYFWDQLEKANYFLQNVIETSDMDIDSRLVSRIFGDGTSDGGQWDMIVNVINKYGIVPQAIFPDSYHAKSSSVLGGFVQNKLREYGLILRKAIADGKPVEPLRREFMEEIYGFFCLTLGTPPKANEKFTWDYKSKNGVVGSVTASPLEFYHKNSPIKVNEYFSLINDPRNDYDKLYTVDRLSNVVGGKPIEYVNVEISELKQAAINAIQNNELVFFGSDVGKFSDAGSGYMDTKVFHYDLALNATLNMDKAQRLKTGSSQMTHAMVLTAVHLVDGKPVRWRVENSWGADNGEKGYELMTDEWFDEYVFQVVTTAKYTSKKNVDILKGKEYTVLPFWDPMGALA